MIPADLCHNGLLYFFHMQKITPFLWFDNNAEAAMNFYVSIFENAKIATIKRYPEGMREEHMKGMEGKVLTGVFELLGHQFMALDGGPLFKINPSISFMVNFDPSRDPQAVQKLDELWNKLSDGGSALMPLQEYPFSKRYGWIQDRFGVSWQLILTDPAGEPRPNIIPSLLFVGDVCGRAEEALGFYASVFKDSKIGTVAKYPAGMEPDKEGTLMFGEAQLAGQWFAAMDSAHEHQFSFTEGVSLLVDCKNQEEIDYYWNAFTKDGGEESQCGWCKDKFGVSWQIAPHMEQWLTGPDTEGSKRALQAMFGMKKIDIAALEAAYNGAA